MHTDICILKTLLLLLLLSVPARAVDWFVAPSGGGESGSGTFERPFRSIGGALAVAQPGDRVVLRGGEYRLAGGEGTIKFPRAGQIDKPITLTAHNEEYAALLGSVRLVDWQVHQDRVFKCPVPARPIYGLYEDAARLDQPRVTGKRENPPVEAITGPGQWTVQGGWVYLWCREGDSPANHRIEASQIIILTADQPWLRIEKLHLFFGQPIGLNLKADHVVADGVEVAHVSNSVDNAYAAYFNGCSNSVLRNSIVHDSYYWGDHGSNSHLVSCIDCGDWGPNFVENCDLFNGGLGVGTKEAAREMVVLNNRIRDVCRGVVISGERQSGPGAGKTDRGHYLVYGNAISDCSMGVYFASGSTHQNRIYNNRFEKCGNAIHLFEYEGLPDRSELANNLFIQNGSAIFCVAGRKGVETLGRFHEAGLRSHHNLFFRNRADWCNPLDWSRSLEKSVKEIQSYRDLGWEAGSLGRDPAAEPTAPAGAPLDLPAYIPKPKDWIIGPGPSVGVRSAGGLTLSITGCPETVATGEPIVLRAVLRNAGNQAVAISGDAIVTFYFRSANVWHFDKQQIHRTRVQLPDATLAPGQTIDLVARPGWANPTSGKPGDPFHLRNDGEWRSGWRLSASVQRVPRDAPTTMVLQRLEPVILGQELLRLRFQ